MSTHERLIFTVGDGYATGLDVIDCGDTVSFHNHDDWCGDTESGFGAEVIISVKHDDVLKLIIGLSAWAHRQFNRHMDGDGLVSYPNPSPAAPAAKD